MFEPRHLVATAVILATAVPVIGVDRIVVTDGEISARSAQPVPYAGGADVAFKSDYFPLER